MRPPQSGTKCGTLVEKATRSSFGDFCSSIRSCGAILLAAAQVCAVAAIEISPAEAQKIGRRIWQNECGGTISGLTSWNAGETFASLGIGHFIWYPKGQRGPFAESFPPLVDFVATHGGKLPELLLKRDRACPWNSQRDFEAAGNSAEMKALRKFLVDTIDFQARFLVVRLKSALPKMLAEAPTSERQNIERQFERVGATTQGCYALVDYVNFKGEGTLASERYRRQGWGLLQVLENMRGDGPSAALDDFSASANLILHRRVANSPPERDEARWLPGWLARVESYRSAP
jgi:hypothetical protein